MPSNEEFASDPNSRQCDRYAGHGAHETETSVSGISTANHDSSTRCRLISLQLRAVRSLTQRIGRVMNSKVKKWRPVRGGGSIQANDC